MLKRVDDCYIIVNICVKNSNTMNRSTYAKRDKARCLGGLIHGYF